MERNKIIYSASTRKINSSETADIVEKNETKDFVSIVRCQACSSNQSSNENSETSLVRSKLNQRRRVMDIKFMKGFPIWSVLILTWIHFFAVFTEGLQCYECLSLHCDSGAVCDAIKSTMLEIFFPKRHFIHFDPSDICPENELPMNPARWANLSRECERSDSICLVSPIEVHTVVDGKKDGKLLEKEYTLMTHGHLRGCASRRKLKEFPETINVRVEFTGRNESSKSSSTGSSTPNSSGSGSNQKKGDDTSGKEQRGNNVSKKQTEIFYNLTNVGNGAAEFDPTKKKYKDGYTITKIYSHVFYIDQDTKNATRCYEDNCNDKVKSQRSGSSTSGMEMNCFSCSVNRISILCVAVLLITSS